MTKFGKIVTTIVLLFVAFLIIGNNGQRIRRELTTPVWRTNWVTITATNWVTQIDSHALEANEAQALTNAFWLGSMAYGRFTMPSSLPPIGSNIEVGLRKDGTMVWRIRP